MKRLILFLLLLPSVVAAPLLVDNPSYEVANTFIIGLIIIGLLLLGVSFIFKTIKRLYICVRVLLQELQS